MDWLIKILTLLGLSAFKYLIAIPFAKLAGFTWWQTLVLAIIGGMIGITAFLYLSEYLFKVTFYIGIFLRKLFRIKRKRGRKPRKKIFSTKNRLFVKLITTYGITGLALITPGFLSFPLGTIIAARLDKRYIKDRFKVWLYMVGGAVIWAIIITTITYQF